MGARPGAVGSVVSMWRYPVKSMQGEELPQAALTERGILGDRAYALVDRSTGKVASAKHPGKWGALLACRAAFVEPPRLDAPLPPVVVTLRDGGSVSSAQPDVDRILSRALGREVALLPSAPATATFESYLTDDDGRAIQRCGERYRRAWCGAACRGRSICECAVWRRDPPGRSGLAGIFCVIRVLYAYSNGRRT